LYDQDIDLGYSLNQYLLLDFEFFLKII